MQSSNYLFNSESVGQDDQEEQIMKDKFFTNLGECYQRKCEK